MRRRSILIALTAMSLLCASLVTVYATPAADCKAGGGAWVGCDELTGFCYRTLGEAKKRKVLDCRQTQTLPHGKTDVRGTDVKKNNINH